MVKIENKTALNERYAPVAKKKRAIAIKQFMARRSGRLNRKEFLRFLHDLRDKMRDRGLTEEILQDILNDEK